MKKVIALLLIAAMGACTTACSSNDSGTATDDTATKYEYVFRSLPEPEYIEPAKSFSGGTGTETDPYQIADASELALLAEKVGETEYSNSYYILTNDISLNDTADYENWASQAPKYSWKPIAQEGSFGGSFNGNGHTISGMYINTDFSEEQAYDKNIGLFGEVTGTVQDVSVEKSYICASGYKSEIGSICGHTFGENAEIIKCHSSAKIDLYDADCGGIVGSSFDLIMSDCTFSGEINQIKDNTGNHIGGIVGSGDASIELCENKGTITSDAKDADFVGGIVGKLSEGSISISKNSGKISANNNPDDTTATGVVAGGIAGTVFVSNIGGENASKGVTIRDCENTGEVAGTAHTAGIIGSLSNDKSENSILVTGCKNSGTISGLGELSGIVSLINSESNDGGSIQIEKCENTADVTGNEAGGIIRQLFGVSGDVSIKDCTNSGAITSNELYSAGILTYLMLANEIDISISIENCTNNGKINTTSAAGGILGFSDIITATKLTNAELAIKGCTNNGDLYTSSFNSYVGGIAGVIGLKKSSVSISDCKNSGNIEFEDTGVDEETINLDKEKDITFKLTRMGGGIVGRIGESLVLVADSRKGSNAYINTENAYIQISNCNSSGKFIAPAEDKYLNKYNEPIFTNAFGGVIGSCVGEEDYSVNVTNCTYSNAERGLGETIFDDVGTKIS